MSEATPAASGAPAPSKFRASAVVVLVRGRGARLEVYWVRRSDVVPAMPGFHAFIGGGVNAEDSSLAAAMTPPAGDDAAAAADGFDTAQLRVLEACVIREAFEETGVLLGTGASTEAAALAAMRDQVLEGTTSFGAFAREHGWGFEGGALRYIGRWTTPPFSAARFDSAFFLAEVPQGQEPTIIPGELASGEWIAPDVALAQWKAGDAAFAAPILNVLLELASAASAAGDAFAVPVLERLRSAPRRAGQPVRRIEMKWGIVLHPVKTSPLPPATHTNTYLVGDRDMALIDPGSAEPAELDALYSVIEALAADGRRVACVIATHHHPDHTAGIEAVRERFHVPVLAHTESARAVRPDRTLDDGEIVTLASNARDWSLRTIHTPGHTRGHLSFLHPGTRSLFTGDHIPGGHGSVIIDPPDGDMNEYLESLERLLHEPIETLFPGHGSPQGGALRRIRAMIAHRLERETKVLAALDGTPRPLGELVARAYADTPRELWSYAERSLLAHLLKLEREDRAARDGDRWQSA